MMRTFDPALPPEVRFVLWAMGHGDEIAVVDAHFFAAATGEAGVHGDVLTVDGMDSLRAVRVVLTGFQLDTTFVDHPVTMLEEGRPDLVSGMRLQELLRDTLGFPCAVLGLAYPEFSELVRNCFALIVTGGTRRHGSFILRKGLDITPATVGSGPGQVANRSDAQKPGGQQE